MSYFKHFVVCLIALTVSITLAMDSPAVAKDAEAALLAGLKRIDAGDVDEWITKSCHPQVLCTNSNAIKSLKRYNIPALKKIVGKCLNGTFKDTLKVIEFRQQGDILKLFIECDPKARPRAFSLQKHNGQWMFTKL